MKIAVIGGGFSGLLTAYLLEKQGFAVTVFEKEPYLGGHCQTLIGKDLIMELGTLFSFSGQIKELLIELQIDYKERFIYRSFIDQDFHYTEHMPREDALLLMEELNRLSTLLEPYTPYLDCLNFDIVPEALRVPFKAFLHQHQLQFISDIIAPHLSAFGFGCMDTIQAYYVFKVFNIHTLLTFIRGEKLIQLTQGTSSLIHQLSKKITDLRLGLKVSEIIPKGKQLQVLTPYSQEVYDHVFISTTLPSDVLKHTPYCSWMQKIITNPFVVCLYEVANPDLTTTYYKHHLGQMNKIQFFYVSRQHKKTYLTAYAYGHLTPHLVSALTTDLGRSGITIKRLITTKQWAIFPHLSTQDLTQDFYTSLRQYEKDVPITFVGTLVTQPSIDQLYVAIRHTIESQSFIDL